MRRRPRDRGGRPPTIDWLERAQFFSLAAGALQRLRAARAKERRSSQKVDAPLFSATTEARENLEALDDLLTRLESLDPRQARIVSMRYFGGLSIEETAQALGISDDTVKREWTHARAWMRHELSRKPS